MLWQDIVIAIGQWVFIIALIPSIAGKEKPALTTAILSGVMLLAYTATFASLSLWAGSASSFFGACAWFILAWQKQHQDKQPD